MRKSMNPRAPDMNSTLGGGRQLEFPGIGSANPRKSGIRRQNLLARLEEERQPLPGYIFKIRRRAQLAKKLDEVKTELGALKVVDVETRSDRTRLLHEEYILRVLLGEIKLK